LLSKNALTIGKCLRYGYSTPYYIVMLHILKYIKGTLFHGLHFFAYSSLELHAYLDADWVGDPTDHRSTIDYCFFLGDSFMSLHDKNKIVIARSNKENEYQALTDTNSFGFVDYLKTWVSFILLQLSSTVIIKVLSRSLTIMNSMNAQNTLRLIVSLCNNILPLRLLDYSQFYLLIRLLISSPRHVLMNAFKI